MATRLHETAKIFAEAALCFASHDRPTTAGQVTTAAAMGENLTRRLIKAGISFTMINPAELHPQE